MALCQLIVVQLLRNVGLVAGITRILADNLRRLRNERGFTQQELADKSNLSLGTIQGYEGCRRWPERPYLEAISKALKVPETELFRPNEIQSPTIGSLLIALQELEKENKQYKNLIGNLPENLIKKLADPKDPFAIVARAWLGGKTQEIEAAELEIRSKGILRARAKSEREDPSSSEIA